MWIGERWLVREKEKERGLYTILQQTFISSLLVAWRNRFKLSPQG